LVRICKQSSGCVVRKKKERGMKIVIFFPFTSPLWHKKKQNLEWPCLIYSTTYTYKKMISNIYLVCFIVVFFEIISALPYHRYRRQINSPRNDGSFYGERLVLPKVPSGSIVGTYYYGEYNFYRLIIFVFISFFYI